MHESSPILPLRTPTSVSSVLPTTATLGAHTSLFRPPPMIQVFQLVPGSSDQPTINSWGSHHPLSRILSSSSKTVDLKQIISSSLTGRIYSEAKQQRTWTDRAPWVRASGSSPISVGTSEAPIVPFCLVDVTFAWRDQLRLQALFPS